MITEFEIFEGRKNYGRNDKFGYLDFVVKFPYEVSIILDEADNGKHVRVLVIGTLHDVEIFTFDKIRVEGRAKNDLRLIHKHNTAIIEPEYKTIMDAFYNSITKIDEVDEFLDLSSSLKTYIQDRNMKKYKI